MSQEPTLKDQTKKIFKETVDIYNNDLNALLRNPVPIILTVAAMIVFSLVIGWL